MVFNPPKVEEKSQQKEIKVYQLLSSTTSTWQKFNNNVKTHFAFYLGRLYLPTGWFINRHITVYGPSKVYFDILPQPLTQGLSQQLESTLPIERVTRMRMKNKKLKNSEISAEISNQTVGGNFWPGNWTVGDQDARNCHSQIISSLKQYISLNSRIFH